MSEGCHCLDVGMQASRQGRNMQSCETSSMHAGVLRQGLQRHESSGSVVIGMHPCCAAHAEQPQGGPCCRVCCTLTNPSCQSQTACNAGLLRLRSRRSPISCMQAHLWRILLLSKVLPPHAKTPAISSARTLPFDALCWASPAGRRCAARQERRLVGGRPDASDHTGP